VIYGRSGQEVMAPAEEYRRSLAGPARPVAEFSVGRNIVAWQYREPKAAVLGTEACSNPCAIGQPHP